MNKFFIRKEAGLVKEADWLKNMMIQAPEYIRRNTPRFNQYLADRFARVAPRYTRMLRHKLNNAWSDITGSIDNMVTAANNDPTYPRWRDLANDYINRISEYAELAPSAARNKKKLFEYTNSDLWNPAKEFKQYKNAILHNVEPVNRYINKLKDILPKE